MQTFQAFFEHHDQPLLIVVEGATPEQEEEFRRALSRGLTTDEVKAAKAIGLQIVSRNMYFVGNPGRSGGRTFSQNQVEDAVNYVKSMVHINGRNVIANAQSRTDNAISQRQVDAATKEPWWKRYI